MRTAPRTKADRPSDVYRGRFAGKSRPVRLSVMDRGGAVTGVWIMGGLSLVHWIIVALVVLVLFGRGRISEVMGDFGKGIKSFKQGMTDEHDALPPSQQIAPPAAAPPAATTAQPQPATPETPAR